MKLSTDFMMSQPVLLKNIPLISQSYHDIENILHDLKTSEQHRYTTPKDYHRHQYYEACDHLYAELVNFF